MFKIVMANIKMPILVNNNKLQPMSEYIKIDIEKCTELPEKNEDKYGSIMEQINQILSTENDEQEYDSEDDESSQSSQDRYPNSEDEQPLQEDQTQDPDPDQTQDPLFVLLNEIENNRPKKTRQNFTLKTKSTNRKKSTTNFTMKNREPISSNTLDADHSPQQAAEE
jgi:hypothetical protein